MERDLNLVSTRALSNPRLGVINNIQTGKVQVDVIEVMREKSELVVNRTSCYPGIPGFQPSTDTLAVGTKPCPRLS